MAPIPAEENGTALAIDVSNVYYATFEGALRSCPKTGCTAPRTLTRSLSEPDTLLYDAVSNDIFVTDPKNDALKSFAMTGAAVYDAALSSAPSVLAADSAYIYTGLDGGIALVTRDGRPPSTVSVNSRQVSALAVDPVEGSAYAGFGDGSIWKASTSHIEHWDYFAGTDTTSYGPIGQIVVKASTVYWMTSASTSGGGIFTCPTTGCTAPTMLPGTSAILYGGCLFVTSTDVYFVATSSFYRCSLGGCPGGMTLVAPAITDRFSCAEDATSFYFLGPHSVVRLAK